MLKEYPHQNKNCFFGKDNGKQIYYMMQELHMADVFHDTIINSEWYSPCSLSLCNYAIRYLHAYIIYRILNDFRPSNVLEFGLGQSSKIIGQYSNYYGVDYTIVEGKKEWQEWLSDINNIKSHITYIPETIEKFDGVPTRMYQDINCISNGQKYDFILVDAPFSKDMLMYGRIDILKLIPNCLADSWVITFDNSNRKFEWNTIRILTGMLDLYHIPYCYKVYKGEKDVFVLCSTDNYFLTTL